MNVVNFRNSEKKTIKYRRKPYSHAGRRGTLNRKVEISYVMRGWIYGVDWFYV